MAGGHQPFSLSPSSPLEEGEIVPQRVSISGMLTGQSYSQQGHPLPKLNNQPQKPSYVSILQAQEHNSRAVSIAQGLNQSQPSSEPLTMVKYRDPTTSILKPISQHQGKPAIHYLLSEKEALVEKLNLVLIGKFTHGRPSLSNIKIFFQKFKLQGVINVSLADSKHIYIECSNVSDYYWIWLNLSMKIHGFDMRIFKWGADFSPRIESPLAPVWIRIVGMPLYLFDEMSLWQIANAVGKPIRIDTRNMNRTILSFARVCVELDISQQPTDIIWVCIKKENTDIIVERICLQVFYDVLPLYCTACSHIGHGEEVCKRKMGKGSATLNVETTTQKDHRTAATCSDPLQAVRTVWLPVKKHNTAVKLNSENRFGSINLLGGEASKALGISEVDLACVANEQPTKTKAANVIELDPLPRNEDEAAQSLQNSPAAKQIECKTDLEASAVHDWHLVTGKRNNRNNKVQSAFSTSINNQELQQSNQKTIAKEVVDVSTDQITPDVKAQSTCCLTDAILEKRGDAKPEIQQGNAQTKGYTQQKQFITDHTKANQQHSLSSRVDIEANTDSQLDKPNTLGKDSVKMSTHETQNINKGKGILGKGPILYEQVAKQNSPAPKAIPFAAKPQNKGSENGEDPNNQSGQIAELKEIVDTTPKQEVALEDCFELISGKEWKRKKYYVTLHIPDFETKTLEQQKKVLAEGIEYVYLTRINRDIEMAVKIDMVDDGKAPAISQTRKVEVEIEDKDSTSQDWKTITTKKSNGKKGRRTKTTNPSNSSTNTMRMDILRARINKMKRDSPAKRKLIAEFEELQGG